MRILPTALLASVVIHTAAIAWTVSHKIETPALVTLVVPTIEVTTAPPPKVPDEIAVALLDDHTIAPAPRSKTTGDRSAAKPAPGRISTGQHTTSTEVAPTKPAHSAMMTMRDKDPKHAPKELEGPSDAFWNNFEANTKPLQPKDIEADRIADDVAREAEHLNDPRWIANATPEQVYEEREKQIASRAEKDGHEIQQDGRGFKAEHATFTGHVDPDGTAHIDERRSYDPTEILMRRENIDPYASNKLRFLDHTREERYQIGKKYKDELLAHSAVIAQNNLNYLWVKTTNTDERKRALFEMWDECAETGDVKLVAAGTSARLMVVGFIRSHMTGALIYSGAELAAFNAKKKSSAVFDPYNE